MCFRSSYFVENHGLRDAQCIVFAHHKGDQESESQSVELRKYNMYNKSTRNFYPLQQITPYLYMYNCLPERLLLEQMALEYSTVVILSRITKKCSTNKLCTIIYEHFLPL